MEAKLQQVLAPEKGRLCRQCLGRTKNRLDTTELYSLMVTTAQYLGSEETKKNTIEYLKDQVSIDHKLALAFSVTTA